MIITFNDAGPRVEAATSGAGIMPPVYGMDIYTWRSETTPYPNATLTEETTSASTGTPIGLATNDLYRRASAGLRADRQVTLGELLLSIWIVGQHGELPHRQVAASYTNQFHQAKLKR
ncbi:hypothetical protein LTR95_011722 [Oleoguttula sp. CCFEE 5521]